MFWWCQLVLLAVECDWNFAARASVKFKSCALSKICEVKSAADDFKIISLEACKLVDVYPAKNIKHGSIM